MSLRHFIDSGQAFRFPALSMAAPAIFGASAAGLTLKAPDRTGPLSYATENLRMAGFPPQPERFVGRTAVMARSSAALAADSRLPGVLLHGMPGGGKTACALELAYTHEHAFDRLVWFKAPDEGADITGALTDFALTLERDLPGFQMIQVLADQQKLTAFFPRLTELLERSRLLLVIDNAESLLTDSGQWRDAQWAKLFGALTSHTGLGRIIVTTRRVSAETRSTLQPEAVDALTADEALLLARELPNLRRLMATSPDLARRILEIAQGHPKLLELADGQAANPDHLAALTESGTQAWHDQGGLPEGFFTAGHTAAAPSDYLHILATWTKSVTDTLTPPERDLFWFLCCLEEPDRIRPILNANWDDLRQRLGRDGHPPGLDQALVALIARGLAAVREETDEANESYAIHPGIAAAGRAHAGQELQAAVDAEVGNSWDITYQHGSGENDDGSVDIALMVWAGLAAVPYLLRQGKWDRAAVLLHNAFTKDPSRANAAAMLPAITRIANRYPHHADTLALVLQVLDPPAAEMQLRSYLNAAAARGDYEAASGVAGHLADLYQNSGRLAEALSVADIKVAYTQQAGLGPWTQLAAQVRRLHVFADMGYAEQVLDDVRRLRHHVDSLPNRPGPHETIPPWNVREALFDIGRSAAINLGRWQDALDLTAEITSSTRARRAPADDTARAQFNDYYPLLRLNRIDQALDLLLDCRQAFQNADDIGMLGKTLAALADIEDERGHGDAALRLEHDALRYKYLAVDIAGMASSYHNLGTLLCRYAPQPGKAFACHLTTALICALTGIGGTGPYSAAGALRDCAADLLEFGPAADPPADLADLCGRLANIEGTDLPALIEKLSPDPQTAEQTLQDLVAQARALLAEEPADPPTSPISARRPHD